MSSLSLFIDSWIFFQQESSLSPKSSQKTVIRVDDLESLCNFKYVTDFPR